MVAHEADLFDQIDKRSEEEAFAERQRAKGLVHYQGAWMPADRAATLKAEKAKAQRARETSRTGARRAANAGSNSTSVSVISNGGKKVNLEHVKKKGKITLVDFYATWCGPCRKISPYLEEMANRLADVHLVKIDIVNWDTPVVKQFKLTSIPHIRVYNKAGKQVGPATSNPNQVLAAVKKAS